MTAISFPKSLAVAAAGLAMFFSSELSLAQENIATTRIINDIAYFQGEGADAERHALNLVLPADGAPRATVLWIHGGAWASGGREHEMGLAEALAREGIAVAVMSYRLSPGRWMSENLPDTGIQHPAHIEDVARAFAWMWENADAHGLDRDALFVSGFSAGGHLSALLATDERYLQAHDLTLDAVAGSIPVAGTYDVPHYYDVIHDGMGADAARDHVIGVFGPREGHAAASPITYLDALQAPMLILSEGQTGLYTDHFATLIDGHAASELISFEHYPDDTHASLYFNMIDPEVASPARQVMLDFIDGVLVR
ncbi:alpha/beta hydrolase [Maricaulis sp.]|uniref:alpha/beta hydrolase n=1 Tax=Maricaulis sp. TaxID=1486257 RepID=UPI00260F3D06|nr:alpha/beta hydrolase [Maricaulis sp.]